MKITKDEINHVAALSRLEFGEDKIDKFTEQMGDIINMAHQLAEVDTEGVPETVQVVDRETDFREDKPEHWESRAELMFLTVSLARSSAVISPSCNFLFNESMFSFK